MEAGIATSKVQNDGGQPRFHPGQALAVVTGPLGGMAGQTLSPQGQAEALIAACPGLQGWSPGQPQQPDQEQAERDTAAQDHEQRQTLVAPPAQAQAVQQGLLSVTIQTEYPAVPTFVQGIAQEPQAMNQAAPGRHATHP